MFPRDDSPLGPPLIGRKPRPATLRPDGWPQATTVDYASDGLTLYFLCGPDSQKAANLARDDRVSLTIDHDTPQVMDITGLSMDYSKGFGHTELVAC